MFTPLRDFYYAGYMITLLPQRKADGQWGCRYFILMEGLKAGPKEEVMDAGFATSLAAELAALKAAKHRIDSEIAPVSLFSEKEETTGQGERPLNSL